VQNKFALHTFRIQHRIMPLQDAPLLSHKNRMTKIPGTGLCSVVWAQYKSLTDGRTIV